MVSSPIHCNDDSDPILRYAPPHARQQGRAPPEPAAPPLGRTSQPPPAGATDNGAIIEMRRRLALEPNRVPEPPQDVAPPRDLWPLALQASIALAAAAVVAWVVTALPSAMQHGRTALAAASPGAPVWANSRSTFPPSGTISPVAVRSVGTLAIAAKPQAPPPYGNAEPPTPEPNEQPDLPSRALAAAPSTESAAVRPPADADTVPPERARGTSAREPSVAAERTPDFVTRQLAGDKLAAMLQRAGDFIKPGDLSSARLLLRAAEAGSEEAALTLAGTFDPNILAVRVFQDGAADIALARLWYERAAQFGSPEAPRRLRLLANNSLQ
jgi:hypothetical protein